MSTSDLLGLMGSRLCHDIISPLGAVGNGLELLAMSGTAPGPELQLVEDSVASATARLELYRLAFGAAAPGQMVQLAEVQRLTDIRQTEGRTRYSWTGSPAIDRVEARLAILCLLCIESALPLGGEIACQHRPDQIIISAKGPRLSIDGALWDTLGTAAQRAELSAKTLQFALLAQYAQDANRTVAFEAGEDWLILRL